MQQTSTELSFDEQTELNQAIINKIQIKIPKLKEELETCTIGICGKRGEQNKRRSRQECFAELQDSLDQKLDVLQEQENEKVGFVKLLGLNPTLVMYQWIFK